ncbi:hypothetical protein B0H14DRAFT_1675004 [Mycena olivaceomarginata]|nr:hypothetical protein B0H14DRAFT_1675004 [Mycena olivaceomarginata]
MAGTSTPSLLPLPPQIHPPRRGRRRLRPHGRDPRCPRPQRGHPPAPRPHPYLTRHHSWDAVFQNSVIRTLTHLDLVDTRTSQLVLGRVAHARALVSLTLHGTFEDVKGATVIFAGDHVLDEGEGGGRQHTLLPHLHSFRFLLVGHDDQHPLYAAVAAFLVHRPLLRRLDLGRCPWELVRSLLPTLSGLKVLGVRIAHFNSAAAQGL